MLSWTGVLSGIPEQASLMMELDLASHVNLDVLSCLNGFPESALGK